MRVYLVLFGGNVQRSVAIFGDRVRRRSFVEQEKCNALMVVVTRHMQRSNSILFRIKHEALVIQVF